MSVLRPVNCIVTLFSGLKDALFNAYLLEDASYLLFSLVLIMLLVWAYTASLTITLASLLPSSLFRYSLAPKTNFTNAMTGFSNNPIYPPLSAVLSTWTEPETYFG